MKTALGTILIFAALVAQVFGANPAFQSFDTNDFTITPSLSNPKLIHANRFGVTNSFTNSVIIYSNTVVIMDGTNLAIINPTDTILPYRVNSNTFGDSSLKWLDTHSIQGTNFTTKSKLEADGSLVTGLSGNYILGAGPNTINLTNSAFVFLSSLSSAATIQLTTGSAVGARALLFNADTNFSFTLTNAPLADDGGKSVAIAGGTWTPSQLGESIQLVYTGSGWFEEGRANPNTNSIPLINPTDTYLPQRVNANTFGDSSLRQTSPTAVEGVVLGAITVNASNVLSSDGRFVTRASGTTLLGPGTNQVSLLNSAVIYLASLGGAGVVIELSAAGEANQHAWLINTFTNPFTLYSGPLYDDTNQTAFIRGGQWSPTELGESIALLSIANGWVEVGRANPNGPQPALGTNYWTNILGTLKPIEEASGTNQFTIDANTGWTGSGTNWFGDDGKFHSTTFNTNGGNLSGSLSAPFLPYATGTDTLADSPVYRVDGITAATTNFVAVNITNTGDFASGLAVYTFPSTVGGGDLLMAGAVTVPTGFDPYYHVALEWRGATTNALTNITVEVVNVKTNITINGTNIASVNPTDGYLPVRASASSFQDSPIHIVSPSFQDVIFDGKVIFGPGTTNTILRNGNDFVATNSGTQVELEMRNGAAKSAFFGISSSGQVEVRAANGANAVYLNDGTDIAVLFGGSFVGNTTVNLGTGSNPWAQIVAGSTNVWKLMGVTSSVPHVEINGTDYALGGGGGSTLWTNVASVTRLIATNSNLYLNLSADDGSTNGTVRLITANAIRWSVDPVGNLYPEPSETYSLGTSIHRVGTIYGSGLLGIKLGDTSISAGNASPEGVVIAEIGSLWMQTNAAPGYTLWTKTNGTGTTGWATVQYPWYTVAATNAAIDGQVIFGPGTTNVVYRDGNNLNYTNGGDTVFFRVTKGSGAYANMKLNNGDQAFLESSGNTVGLLNNSVGVILSGNGFTPNSGDNVDLSSWNDSTKFRDFAINRKGYFMGFESGTNLAYGVIYHPGTNNPVAYDSYSVGTAGPPQGHNFMVGGTNLLQVKASSTAKDTSLLLFDVDTGTIKRVSVGTNDSGGAGFKVLLVPN